MSRPVTIHHPISASSTAPPSSSAAEKAIPIHSPSPSMVASSPGALRSVIGASAVPETCRNAPPWCTPSRRQSTSPGATASTANCSVPNGASEAPDASSSPSVAR